MPSISAVVRKASQLARPEGLVQSLLPVDPIPRRFGYPFISHYGRQGRSRRIAPKRGCGPIVLMPPRRAKTPDLADENKEQGVACV